ncbi:MAG: UbiX family flavin prenyltransferase [Proteobacteria bacterium]|nr:UbiX family flavin prenyltransferase [Pseudomonadota bacterium]
MIAVAITGASGPIMGIRLIEELLNNSEEVYAVVSNASWQIIEHELSYKKKGSFPLTDLIASRGKTANTGLLKEFDDKDFFSPLASGSTLFEAMVVIPCSMKTLSGIAHGYADSLITRACDVSIKEKRKLIIVPRETPLSLIHIENMHKIALAGAIILPPVISFYTLPKSTDDMVDFITGKVLNLLGKKNTLFESWGNSSGSTKEILA